MMDMFFGLINTHSLVSYEEDMPIVTADFCLGRQRFVSYIPACQIMDLCLPFKPDLYILKDSYTGKCYLKFSFLIK